MFAVVAGGVAALIAVMAVTSSRFGDPGRPIDRMFAVGNCVAGFVGTTIGFYAVLGMAKAPAERAVTVRRPGVHQPGRPCRPPVVTPAPEGSFRLVADLRLFLSHLSLGWVLGGVTCDGRGLGGGVAVAVILLIDDDARVRSAIRRVLEQAGHSVIDVAHGGEAMARFAEREIDLIVTDLLMPEVEGLEVLMAARQRSPALPVLVISGGFSPERGGAGGSGADYLRMARQLGATRTLAKPFERTDLLEAVAACLSERGRDRPPG